MRVAELYASIQGEGHYAGEPSVFVRLTGCNLRCWFCDTPFTSWQPEGTPRSWQSVLEEVLRFSESHVVLTGGEPLLQPDIVPLSAALQHAGKIVTLETAGTVDRPVTADLFSISPKLHNSTPPAARSSRWQTQHEALRDRPEVIRRLLQRGPYQMKFVVDQPADLKEIENYLQAYPEISGERIWLMPQARSEAEIRERESWLREAARQRGWNYTGRWQIEQFGNVRGR